MVQPSFTDTVWCSIYHIVGGWALNDFCTNFFEFYVSRYLGNRPSDFIPLTFGPFYIMKIIEYIQIYEYSWPFLICEASCSRRKRKKRKCFLEVPLPRWRVPVLIHLQVHEPRWEPLVNVAIGDHPQVVHSNGYIIEIMQLQSKANEIVFFGSFAEE